MGSRVTPEENRVLLKPEPIAVGGAEVGPMNSETGSKVAVKKVGEWTAVASNWAAEMAIGYRHRGGAAKMKTVIPKRRKLVKTMMYHSIKDFIKSLFRPPPLKLHNRQKPTGQDQ